MGDRTKLILVLMLTLIAISMASGADLSREVPASDVLAKIKADQPVEFDNCTIVGDLNLSGLKIETPVNFNHTIFQNSVTFNFTTFNGTANFMGSEFNSDAEFRGSEFNNYASFYSSKFNGEADFTESEFNNGAEFRGSEFNNYASFYSSKFNGKTKFGDSSFPVWYGGPLPTQTPNFEGSKFNDVVTFESSEFNGDIDFGRSEFNGGAFFSRSKFNRTVYFILTKFNGVLFLLSEFNDGAFFSDSKFNLWALFGSSKFNGKADFTESKFNGYVEFRSSKFNNIADFSKSEFNDCVEFIDAEFEKKTNFKDVDFNNITSFNSSLFAEGALFENTTFHNKLSLTNTRYDKLFIRWHNIKGGLVYDDAAYMSLLKNFKDLGYFEDYDSCYFQYRIEHRGLPWPLVGGLDEPIRKIIDFFLEWSYGYGTRPLNAVYFSLAIIIVFGIFWKAIGLGGPRDVTGEDSKTWEKPDDILEIFSFSITVFLSGTRLFIDPPDLPKINGWSRSMIKMAYVLERTLGALFSILFFLAISGTVIR